MKTLFGITKDKFHPYKGKATRTTATRADQIRTRPLKRSDYSIHAYPAAPKTPNYSKPLKISTIEDLLKYYQGRIRTAQLEIFAFNLVVHAMARYGHSPSRLDRKASNHLASDIAQALNCKSFLKTTRASLLAPNRVGHHQKNNLRAQNFHRRNLEMAQLKIATKIKKRSKPELAVQPKLFNRSYQGITQRAQLSNRSYPEVSSNVPEHLVWFYQEPHCAGSESFGTVIKPIYQQREPTQPLPVPCLSARASRN